MLHHTFRGTGLRVSAKRRATNDADATATPIVNIAIYRRVGVADWHKCCSLLST